ncbi:FAD-dependent thymidylate synthase [Seleniivibrio sp.]|uniref:FAD-dependent thymidylate synthase n=1 Tax=Seleniivibrio sp. TaxID=2898801 RepID=UPI0025ED1DBF|nr:FAD-dependent thymidylate synthase [Seleniivibrio sp.]MCD8555016.1 FAD-dependent thymidylate synthase [Seleniivibrio sp.]
MENSSGRKGGLNVKLVAKTADGELVSALAAKLCYSDSDIDGLLEKISSKEQSDFIQKIVSMGHHSVLEHLNFTFGVEGVSRALTHQLVRHRIASYSQKSQRYVKHGPEFEYITPHTIADKPELLEQYEQAMQDIGRAYDALLKAGVPAEDARYVLPNACETKIIITMNARELLHYFSIRCCERAQWEIREMSFQMLRLCRKEAPSIFGDAGPGCVRGKCPEGSFTCGKAKEIREKFTDKNNFL